MRRISSPLLVLIACSMAVQAADQTTNRAVRQEEGRQKGLTTQTSATGREVSGLIDEYRFNGLGDENKLKVLDKLQKDLVRLTDANVAGVQAGEDSTTMPWVTTRLNAARQLQNLVELRKELMAASTGQDHVIVQIDKLLKQMQEQFGKQLKTDLGEVIQEQQRLKDATEKLAEKTLGEKTEKLSAEQKQDLEKTSDQQEALEEQVKEAIEELKEQAKDQSQPEQAKSAKEALEKLQDPKVQEAIEEAAKDIKDNQLAQAQEAQQQVLDALKEAQQELAQSDAADSQPQDPSAAELEQQLAQLENIAEQQQQLLDKTNALDAQSTPQEFNQLQAQQAELQSQTAELAKDMQSAAQQAQQQALEKQQAAQQAQQQAQQNPTAANKEAAQQAQQEASQAQDAAAEQAQGASPEVQEAQAAADQAQAAAEQAQQQGQGEQAQQAQAAAEQAQQQALAAMANSASQQAQQAMQAAQQDLGQMAESPAAQDMQAALAALAQMQASMQEALSQKTGKPKPGKGKSESEEPPQLVVQSESQTDKPKEAKELGADLQNGEKREPAGPAAWQVGLPPKEREALSAAQKDKFPTRYERQLALYYQNLASGSK